jgi:hypothetical protein
MPQYGFAGLKAGCSQSTACSHMSLSVLTWSLFLAVQAN